MHKVLGKWFLSRVDEVFALNQVKKSGVIAHHLGPDQRDRVKRNIFSYSFFCSILKVEVERLKKSLCIAPVKLVSGWIGWHVSVSQIQALKSYVARPAIAGACLNTSPPQAVKNC
jgi:hypothetical protein